MFNIYPGQEIYAKSVREAREMCILRNKNRILDYLNYDDNYQPIGISLAANYYEIDRDIVVELAEIILDNIDDIPRFLCLWDQIIDAVWKYYSMNQFFGNKSYNLFLDGKESFYKKLNYGKPSFELIFDKNIHSCMKYFHNIDWPTLIEYENITCITKYAIKRIIKKTRNNNYYHIYRLMNIFIRH